MAKRTKYLVDTSVLIGLLRGNENAKIALETISKDEIYICVNFSPMVVKTMMGAKIS